MNARDILHTEAAPLSRKPPLGENRPRPLLVWENPQLTAGAHREKSKAKLSIVSGQTLYAYVLGNPVFYIDPTGLDVYVAVYPGENGNPGGHIAAGVNTTNTVGLAPSPDASTWDLIRDKPVPAIMEKTDPARVPESSIVIHTTPAQDKEIQDYINSKISNPGSYRISGPNCATTVHDALGAGGVGSTDTMWPRDLMKDLKKRYSR